MSLHHPQLLDPQEVADSPDERVGGKSRGLSRLERAKAPVPPFWVVDSAAFEAHLSLPQVRDTIRDQLQALDALDADSPAARASFERAADALQQAVCSAPLDQALARALDAALDALQEHAHDPDDHEHAHAHEPASRGTFAVRSSMHGEDSDLHSFAGQLESFLFQRSAQDVAQSVVRCWASAFSAHALAYRKRSGLSMTDVRMGVVIQRMIAGRVSGVAFSAHPITGVREHVLITAAWGCGEGVVSGLCNTDEYTVEHDGHEVAASLAVKDVQIVQRPDGAGTEEAPVAAPLQRIRCMTPSQVEALGAEVVRLARALGKPQDIEWTLDARDQLYIVQSRPITALPEAPHLDGPKILFDNSNIQESYCGVTTPLTFSFASDAYARVYAQTMRVFGLPEEVVREHEPLLRNLLGLVRGRVYYNLNNWYRGLQVLPSFGRNKEDMEAMMGVDEPVDFVEDERLSVRQKAERAPRLLYTYARLMWLFRRLPQDVPRFLADFERAYAQVDRAAFGRASFSQLMTQRAFLRDAILERWTTPIVNDFFVMMSMGKLRRWAAQALGDGAQATALVNDLLAGEEGIESTEPTHMLMRMARRAALEPDLAQIIRHEPALEAVASLRQASAWMRADIDAYIERYGDRTIGELKLETISLREDPSFIVHVLKNYLDRPDLDPQRLRRQEQTRRAQAEQRLMQRLGSSQRKQAAQALHQARSSVKNRENMRLARTRLFGLFRDLYRALGHRLHEADKLDAPLDIFYLTIEEIDAYHEGRAVSAELKPLALARRAEYAAYESQPLPHRFQTRGPVYHGNRFEPSHQRAIDPMASTLQGTGCYPGVVEARLKIILSPKDELSVDGQILTTVRTDPGWAPLFPTASGILVERGSTLSHSAVVARELGIPAVVGVPDLLAIVKPMERVTLDGATGLITRRLDPLDPEAQP